MDVKLQSNGFGLLIKDPLPHTHTTPLFSSTNSFRQTFQVCLAFAKICTSFHSFFHSSMPIPSLRCSVCNLTSLKILDENFKKKLLWSPLANDILNDIRFFYSENFLDFGASLHSPMKYASLLRSFENLLTTLINWKWAMVGKRLKKIIKILWNCI